MAMLHVMCDELGHWRVFKNVTAAPLSEHSNATDAELAAWRHAGAFGADAILVHDRYGRTHESTRCLRSRARPGTPKPAGEETQ
jgi:hypothetical protein